MAKIANIKTFIYEPLNKGHTDIEKTCIIVIEIFFKRKYKCIIRLFSALYIFFNEICTACNICPNFIESIRLEVNSMYDC